METDKPIEDSKDNIVKNLNTAAEEKAATIITDDVSTTTADIKKQTEEATCTKTDAALDATVDVKPDIEPVVEHDIKPDVKPDVKPDFRTDVSNDDSNGVTSTVNSDVPTETTREVRPDIRTNVKSDANASTEENICSEEDRKWHTVGIFESVTNALVKDYIDNKVWTSHGRNITTDELPDLTQYARINLEPGTSYRFRLRAINSIGASEWGDTCNIKTCLPGFPGAPSAIKIAKTNEGAQLTWEPPPLQVDGDNIIEYSVYLAIKPHKDAKPTAQRSTQLVFVRVYVGEPNECTVTHTSLAAAHVDYSNKPAIIFRIAARNEKGYGPATQVRWLQDGPPFVAKKATDGVNATPAPLNKPDGGVSSPIKRFKPNNKPN